MQETLTPAEWTVMTALWENAPMTLSEVIRQIGARADWSYRTYASYLNILVRKGFVCADTRCRDKLYSPAVERGTCIRAESRSILGKVQAGAVKELVVNMVREGKLAAEDRQELIAMLEKLGEGEDEA